MNEIEIVCIGIIGGLIGERTVPTIRCLWRAFKRWRLSRRPKPPESPAMAALRHVYKNHYTVAKVEDLTRQRMEYLAKPIVWPKDKP